MNSANASTEKDTTRRPRVYIDSDVLLAAAASSRGASHIIIKLSELTLIEGVISEAVRVEVERNLQAKLPAALPASGTIQVVKPGAFLEQIREAFSQLVR